MNIARKDDPEAASVDVGHILDTAEGKIQSQHIIKDDESNAQVVDLEENYSDNYEEEF